MAILRQILLGAAVLAATLYVWITYVPSAKAMLDRVGVLAVLGIDPADPASEKPAQTVRRSSGPVTVLVAELIERAIADKIQAIGDGRAQRSVVVRSEAVGLVTKIAERAGTYIEAGTVIARLEDEAESIALERARIVLDGAEDDSDRVKRLGKSGAVTEVRAQDAELALRTAELELRQAQFNLDRRRIIAPISGWVGIMDMEVGDRITAQQALVTITDRSEIVIDFRVPERVIGKMSVGMPFLASPLGLRDVTLTGDITAIDTIVDRASRTLRVQGRVNNDNDQLLAGMAFSVSLSFPGATLLAADPLAVQWSSEGAFVWVVRDDKAARVPVIIRQRNSDQVLIEGDLKPGELVVIEGVQSLRPGTDVSVKSKAAAKSAALPTAKL